MGKSYNIITSSLFAKNNTNYIPDWINTIDINQIQQQPADNIPIQSTKVAAFNTAPKVCRDDRDFNSRPVNNHLNNTGLVLAAKTELAKFLSGKYYTTKEKAAGNSVQLTTNISHVPATFTFNYSFDKGKMKAARLFSINANDQDGEYPFNKSGFNECLEDLKTGKIKTATKAQAYKAYTITLEEIVRRFNGDHRAALDRARELVASQDLIGVNSNTFATCYAIDSLFPKLKKEGSVDNSPTFEFVENKEHVDTNPNASAAALIVSASKKLHELFDDFKIHSFERKNDKLIVAADILHNKQKKCVAFNFGINNEQIQGIAYVNDNNNNLPLKTFLEENEMSNVLDAFSKKTNREKHLQNGIVLTKDFIFSQLKDILADENIMAVIDNWIDRELIVPVNSTTYMSKLSFNDLLNNVNTKLLTEDEKATLYEYSSRIQSYIDRIKAEDDIRDYNIVFSPMIRLTNLYNRLSNFIENFVVDEINDDCTKVFITSLSERGPEQVCIFAKYDGNKLVEATTQDKKNITAALNTYKKLNKHNIYAKSIFSQSMLKQALSTLFKDVNFDLIKNRFELQKLGNNFYASNMPISAIVNTLASENLATTLTKSERKQLLKKQARRINKITGTYVQDLVRDNIDYSCTIRLASAFNELSKQLPNFTLQGYNKDCSKIKLKIKDEQGIKNIVVAANYDDNKCTKIIVPDVVKSEGLVLYKQANKNNIFANSLFSKRMLLRIFSNIFKDPEQAANTVLTKLASKIDNTFYVSKFPISAMIESLSKHNYQVLNDEERKELLDIQAYFGKKITASYEQDSDTRRTVVANKMIRLANLYPLIERKYKQFHIQKVNDDVTNIEITQNTPIGLAKANIKVAYTNNKPVEIQLGDLSKLDEQEIITAYQAEHGTAKYAKKIVFSKNMLKTMLKPLVKQANLDEAVEQITDQAEKLDNNYYGSDKPLTYLLNNISIPVNKSYDIQKRIDEQVIREDETDTGTRNIEFTENIISALNKASKYFSNFFKDFTIKDAEFLENEHLNYNVEIFDKETGLKNNINCTVNFKDGNVCNCKININNTSIPIEKVKQAFNTNPILSKYLQHHVGKRTNSPVIISANNLVNRLYKLTNKSKDELYEIINSWNENDKIKKIASNAYVSNYTVEQLLSMSSLVALTDDDIKQRLSKRNNLLKLSKAYIKDTGDRLINENWNLDKYVSFIRSELNKMSTYSKVLDASINDNKLQVKAEIGNKGLRHIIHFSWDISNQKPDNCTYKMPYISPVVQKYIEKHASNDFNSKFSISQLENTLFGFANKEAIKTACDLFVDKNILVKNGNEYISNYSIPELLRFMDKYQLIDSNKVDEEVKLANRSTKIDTNTYKMNDASRMLNNDNKKYMDKACEKLKTNIKLAMNNNLITKRTGNVWLDQLNDVNNVMQVCKEFTQYLKAK